MAHSARKKALINELTKRNNQYFKRDNFIFMWGRKGKYLVSYGRISDKETGPFENKSTALIHLLKIRGEIDGT